MPIISPWGLYGVKGARIGSYAFLEAFLRITGTGIDTPFQCMDNTTAFAESWINARHTVLGKELRPLCIFHLLWLNHFNSPLVFTSNQITLEDLEIGVIICSSSSNEEIFKALTSKEFTLWQKTRNYFWRRANRYKRDFKTELQKFISYNDDYIALPKLFPKDEAENNDAFPWLLLNATALIKNTGWTEKEVFELPIGKIIWFNLTFGYLATGETTLLSEKEELAIEALKSLTGKK